MHRFTIQYFLGFTALWQVLFSRRVSSLPVVISSLDINGFLQSHEMQVELNSSYANHRIIIEMDVISPSSVPNLELILLAGEPSTNMPGFYELLFAYQRVGQYKNSNINVDQEGFGSLRRFQFIDIHLSESRLIGQWNLRVYDLNTDIKEKVCIQLRVISLGEQNNSEYCPQSCNSNSNELNKCIGQRDNLCRCSNSFTGETCLNPLVQGSLNKKTDIFVDPLSWQVYWIPTDLISSWENRVNAIALKGEFTIRLAFVYGCTGELLTPNIISDVFEVSDNGSGVLEYPLVPERLRQMKNSTIIANCEAEYPHQNKLLNTAIQIGFFNPSSSKTVSLTFELISNLQEKGNGIMLFNRGTIIVLLAFCCFIMFCVSPITYFIIQKRRKENSLKTLQRLFGRMPYQHHETDQEQEGDFPGELPPSARICNSRNNNNGVINLTLQQNLPQNGYGLNQIAQPVELQIQQSHAGAVSKIGKKVVPITKDTINKFMPKQEFREVVRLYPILKDECNSECMVCLEQFEEESGCRITPCFHVFHAECVESWFAKHSTCPYCRTSCNRKGIYQQLTKPTINPYIERILKKEETQNGNSNQESDKQSIEKKPQQSTSANVLALAGSILKTISKPVSSFFKENPKNLQEIGQTQTIVKNNGKQLVVLSIEELQSRTLQNPNVMSINCFSSNEFLAGSSSNSKIPVELPNSPKIPNEFDRDCMVNIRQNFSLNSEESPPQLQHWQYLQKKWQQQDIVQTYRIGDEGQQPKASRRCDSYLTKQDPFSHDFSQLMPSTTRKMMIYNDNIPEDEEGVIGCFSGENPDSTQNILPKQHKVTTSKLINKQQSIQIQENPLENQIVVDGLIVLDNKDEEEEKNNDGQKYSHNQGEEVVSKEQQ